MRDVRREVEVVAYTQRMVDDGLWHEDDVVMDKRTGRVLSVRVVLLEGAGELAPGASWGGRGGSR